MTTPTPPRSSRPQALHVKRQCHSDPCALFSPLPLPPAKAPTVSRGQPLEGASQRHEGFSHTATKGTRPTQSTKVRHTPRRSVPHYVSPFVGARYPVHSGQVGAGRTAQAFVSWDLSAQSGGASNLPSPWERPGVEEIYYFFLHCMDHGLASPCEGRRLALVRAVK